MQIRIKQTLTDIQFKIVGSIIKIFKFRDLTCAAEL